MPWFKKSSSEPLRVAMAGVKLADRVLVIGCSDPPLIAALAVKSGLTGRACAVDPSAERAGDAARLVEREGALVETAAAPMASLPYEAGSFDVVVLRDALGRAESAGRAAIAGEALRVLRPGGRALAIETSARAGLGGLWSHPVNPEFHAGGGAAAVLTAAGFAAVRTLAEREDLTFAEGVKRNA